MKTNTTKKTLSFSLRTELEKLQDNKEILKIKFTAEQDALLLEFWPIKIKSEIAKIFKMSEGTLRNRYRELITNGGYGPMIEQPYLIPIKPPKNP